MLTIWGSAAIGAVWGWLIALVAGRQTNRLHPLAIGGIFLASTAVGGTIIYLSDGQNLLVFILTTLLALAIHLAFLASLEAGASA